MVNPTIIWWGNNLYYSRLTSERSLCIYMVRVLQNFHNWSVFTFVNAM